ncbi:(2Fe-2S)-binding protein [Streptomyces aureocirculatus]|uniref:(2Fe-2S)-binding protein n=1 Tax=Streptomyces aureocirculatus TaxID=67275 RepID=UPI001CECB8A2|nr:(2Fe-2S)-binding protein [Streptomyces aureocirculatus]
MTAHTSAIDWDTVGTVGGFFTVRTGEPSGDNHVPLALVYTARPPEVGPDQGSAGLRPGLHQDSGDPLCFRVAKVAGRLGAPEERVAASVAQLGLAARLWSLALGPAALYGRVPDLDPALLRWDADATSPEDLWLAGTRTYPADAARVLAAVQDAHLTPLAGALRARFRVSPALLRGNAGSALAGAARELHAWAAREGRPEVGGRALALAAELFADPALKATGTLEGTAFRRRSCCLYYRCPGGGLCGDCCFDRPPQRSSHGAASG